MDQVTKFMGHDICVHREDYSLSEDILQLAKMRKLQGASSSKGKSPDEIGLNLDSER